MSKNAEGWVRSECRFAADFSTDLNQKIDLAIEGLQHAKTLAAGGQSPLFQDLMDALDTAQMYARQAYEAATREPQQSVSPPDSFPPRQ